MIPGSHPFDDLSLHADHFGSSVERGGTAFPLPSRTKLAGCDPSRKLAAYVSVSELSHATVKHGLKNRPFILNGGALKNMIPGIGCGLLHGPLRLPRLMMGGLPRLRDNAVGLMPELRGQLAVPSKYFFLRQQLFAVTCAVCSHLSSACAISADLLQMILDLRAPWTRCGEILFCVALDLRLAVFPSFELIA